MSDARGTIPPGPSTVIVSDEDRSPLGEFARAFQDTVSCSVDRITRFPAQVLAEHRVVYVPAGGPVTRELLGVVGAQAAERPLTVVVELTGLEFADVIAVADTAGDCQLRELGLHVLEGTAIVGFTSEVEVPAWWTVATSGDEASEGPTGPSHFLHAAQRLRLQAQAESPASPSRKQLEKKAAVLRARAAEAERELQDLQSRRAVRLVLAADWTRAWLRGPQRLRRWGVLLGAIAVGLSALVGVYAWAGVAVAALAGLALLSGLAIVLVRAATPRRVSAPSNAPSPRPDAEAASSPPRAT